MVSRRSTTATDAPTLAAWMAAFWPAGPDPRTTRSKRLPSMGRDGSRPGTATGNGLPVDHRGRRHAEGIAGLRVDGVGDLEQGPLGEGPGDQLEADREPGGGEPGRDRDRRTARGGDPRAGPHPLQVAAHRHACDLRRILLLDRE